MLSLFLTAQKDWLMIKSGELAKIIS